MLQIRLTVSARKCLNHECKILIRLLTANMEVTNKTFAFPENNGIPLYYVSAATGTNVVKVMLSLLEDYDEDKECHAP